MTDNGDAREDVSFVVRHREGETTLTAPRGAVLRDVLLNWEPTTDDLSDDSEDNPTLSPYTQLTARANCGGARALCDVWCPPAIRPRP